MREVIQKEIDGETYHIEQFNTTTGLKVLGRLVKIFGEPITKALSALGAKSAVKGELNPQGLPTPSSVIRDAEEASKKREIDPAALGEAVALLLERLDEDEISGLVKRLTTEGVKCGGKEIDFDEHFAGNFSHLFKVTSAALEAQFGNFLGAITAKIPAAVKAVAPGLTPAV